MIIEEKDFRLTPVKDCKDRFDLEILKTVNKGKESERQEFKVVAYGITLDSAFKYVANARLAEGSDVVDLKTYIQEYKNIIEELKQLCGI